MSSTNLTSASGTWMQPSSTTILWEGVKASLGHAARGRKLAAAKYKVTEDALIFAAGIMSTREEVIPLWAVMDVDLKQSMTQKSRGVGDLVVRLDPAGAKYGQQAVTLESIRDPRSVRDILARQANVMRNAMLTHHHDLDVERRRAGATNFSIGNMPAPAAAPAPAIDPAPSRSEPQDIMNQLRQLGELHAAGVLTDNEFESKKAELLARL